MVIDELVHGGHVAALVLPSIVIAIALARNDPLNLPILAISYLGPLIVYSYNYYGELEKDRLTMPDRTSYLEKKAKAYPVLISAYVGLMAAAVVLYQGDIWKLGIIVGILLAAGILYTLCLKRLTRYVPGFKTYFVTGEWALAAVLMYATYANDAPATLLLAAFCFVFLRVLINVIFSDLKDIRSDSNDGLKTIPVVLGWNGTIRLLYLLNLASPLPLVISALAGWVPGIVLVLIVFIMYDFYYLRHAKISGEASMKLKDYAFADYEFILWPWAIAIGVLLQDWFGPLLPATLVLLIIALSTGMLMSENGSDGQKKKSATDEAETTMSS